MSKLRGLVLLALPGLFAAGMVSPGEDPNAADTRCLAVSFHVMQQPTAELQNAGMMAAIYYVGRLDGRAPTADIESMIVKEVSAMTPEDVSTEAVRCGAILEGRGNELQRIGQNLVRRSQEMQKNESAGTAPSDGATP